MENGMEDSQRGTRYVLRIETLIGIFTEYRVST